MSDRTPLRHRLGVPLALAATSTLLALAAAEGLLRLAGTPSSPPFDRPRLPPSAPVLKSVLDFARPNAVGVMGNGVPYRSNAAGVRGRDYVRPKPPGVFRIAVLGDSVTMGSGVLEDETYAARIERALNDPPGPATYEVVNLGISGLSAGHIVERLEQVGLSYDPDLLLYGYTLNDIEGPTYRRTAAQGNRLMGDLSREHAAPGGLRVTKFLRTRVYSLRELVWPPLGSYVHELDDNYFRNPMALQQLDDAFARLRAIADEGDRCVLVLQHPTLWFLHAFHPFRRHNAVVARLARSHGFATADATDHVIGLQGLALWVGPFDPHPNATGHAILAGAALDALGRLPARCWGGHGPPPAVVDGR